MHMVEMTLTIARDGCLHIPASELNAMGLASGEQVMVAFLSVDGEENSFHEFLISAESLGNVATDESHDIRIPTKLLIQANIPVNADVDIACLDGAILILRSEYFSLADLEEILRRLGLANQELQALIQDE